MNKFLKINKFQNGNSVFAIYSLSFGHGVFLKKEKWVLHPNIESIGYSIFNPDFYNIGNFGAGRMLFFHE